MKKVLIVDDEKSFLASLTEGLSSYSNEFEVLTANDGKQAIAILDSQPIKVILTDLQMPMMDGYQLLAHVMSYCHYLSVIVMTAFATPEIEKHFQDFEAITYLEKPIDFQLLTDKILFALDQANKGQIKGITLFSFLRLLEAKKKTCLVKIKSKNGEGFLFFSAGKIVDAIYELYEGEEAIEKIISWENTEVEVKEMVRDVKKRVNISLSNLLREIVHLKDKDNVHKQILEEDFLSVLDLDDIEIKSNSKPVINEKSDENQKEFNMGNINECLSELMKVDGAMAASVVDAKSGMSLGMAGGGINLELAAAGNSEVVKSKLKTMQNLGIKDKIEDILITLSQQYHLIRPLSAAPSLFIYFVLSKAQSNLALARHKLSDIESRLEV